jgi:hypothetical protein
LSSHQSLKLIPYHYSLVVEIVFWSFSSAGQVRSLDLWMGITSVLPVLLTELQQRARRVARTGSSVPVLPAGIVSLLSPRHQVFCAVAIREDGCFSAQT